MSRYLRSLLFGLGLLVPHAALAAPIAIDPFIFATNFLNVNLGPVRGAPAAQGVWLLASGAPTPDSDAIPLGDLTPDFPDGTTNGGSTVVTAAHPSLVDPLAMFHIGPTTPAGGGWGQYFLGFSDADWDLTDPAKQDPWTITFTNPDAPNVTEATVTTAPGSPNVRPGLVTDASITGDPGAPLQPVLSWSVPNSPPGLITGQTILIWELEFDAAGAIVDTDFKHSEAVPLAPTSQFQIPTEFNGIGIEGSSNLELGKTYQVAIDVNLTDPVTGATGLSRKFFEFTATDEGGSEQIFLPTVTTDPATGNPVYNFDVEVLAGQEILIDPLVAIGYDYKIGAGDPGFASVTLPEAGDDLFSLWLFDPDDNPFDSGFILSSGNPFSFLDELGDFGVGADGLVKFRILGIEISAMLDPNDVQAFVTGLTFVSSGRFTGTQTPLSVFVEVSEPTSLALLLGGLLVLLQRHRRSAAAMS